MPCDWVADSDSDVTAAAAVVTSTLHVDTEAAA